MVGTAGRSAWGSRAAERKELEKKSKPGRDVIISCNGQTVRILASEVLREADSVARSVK